jgi:hypothetical protein
MPIVFRCPACGRELEAPDEALGSTGACRFCGAEITAPASPEEQAILIRAGVAPVRDESRVLAQPTGHLNAFAIFAEADRTYRGNFGLLLLSILIVGVLDIILSQVAGGVAGIVVKGGAQAADLLIGVLLAPLLAGPFYVCARAVAGHEASIGHLFRGYRRSGPLMASSLLFSVPWLLAARLLPDPPAAVQAGTADPTVVLSWLATFMPGAIIAALVITAVLVPVSLTTMEIVDRGSGIMDAVRSSIETTRGRYFAILATRLLLGAVAASGIVLCGIGLVLTVPIAVIGEVLIYRHLRGLQGTLN